MVQNGTFPSFRLKSPYNIEWGQRSESRFDRRSLSGLMSEAPKVTRTLGREARGAKWEFRQNWELIPYFREGPLPTARTAWARRPTLPP